MLYKIWVKKWYFSHNGKCEGKRWEESHFITSKIKTAYLYVCNINLELNLHEQWYELYDEYEHFHVKSKSKDIDYDKHGTINIYLWYWNYLDY